MIATPRQSPSLRAALAALALVSAPGAATAERRTSVSEARPASPAPALPRSQAAGQPADDEIVELPPEPGAPARGPSQGPSLRLDLAARLEQLEQRNEELTQRLQDMERRLQIVTNPATSVRLTGYIDAGFFAFLRGNGSGITNYIAQPNVTGNDPAARYQSFLNDPKVKSFPAFFAPCGLGDTAPVPCPRAAAGLGQARWRFLGDPLATVINSQGHPADVRAQNNPSQSSLAVPYDFIQSGGRPTFIINEVMLMPIAKLGENLQAVASISLYPRSASVSIGDRQDGGSVLPGGPTKLGDYLGVSLAFLEWSPSFVGRGGRHQISVFAGRFDSNLGIEYRVRQSPDRFGVTPSLICRYSCGTPIGLKVRGRFFDDWLQVHLGVHNGASYQEDFRFSEQTDKKYMKTFSGRVALHAPWLGGMELGFSGEYGGEVDGFYDVGRGEFDPFVAQWTIDVDAHLEYRGFELRAEFLKTQADGFIGSDSKPALPRLTAQGAYVEASYRLLNWLGLMARWDFRDAVHVDYSVPYAYDSLLWRLTVGARFDINDNIAFKAEFLHVAPFGRMSDGLADNAAAQAAAQPMAPLGTLTAGDYAADYVTSSLVLRY